MAFIFFSYPFLSVRQHRFFFPVNYERERKERRKTERRRGRERRKLAYLPNYNM